jgi:hypothetical protein
MRNVHPWSEQDIQILAEMVAAGKSKLAIGVRLKRKEQSIARQARLLGLLLPRRKRAFSPAEIDAQRDERLRRI